MVKNGIDVCLAEAGNSHILSQHEAVYPLPDVTDSRATQRHRTLELIFV